MPAGSPNLTLFLRKASNLSDLANAGTARTNLGLGSAALLATGTTNGTIPVIGASDLLAAGILPAMVGDAGSGGTKGAAPAPASGDAAAGKFLKADGTWAAPAGGTSYTFSTGLTDTAGTITANLSTGVSGGQTAIGGTASGNNLTLSSTSHATKGKLVFGTSAYDEVNNRLGVGTAVPGVRMVIAADATSLITNTALCQLRVSGSTSLSKTLRLGYDTTSNFGIIQAINDGVAYSDLYLNTIGGALYLGNATGGVTTTAALTIQRTSGGTGLSCTNLTDADFLFVVSAPGAGDKVVTLKSTVASALAFGVSGTEKFRVNTSGNLVLVEGVNMVMGTTTGTKYGISTSEKQSLWNKTPIVQPAHADQAALTNSTGGTSDGTLEAVGATNTGDVSGAINNNFAELHKLLNAIRTAMTDYGSMKGAA